MRKLIIAMFALLPPVGPAHGYSRVERRDLIKCADEICAKFYDYNNSLDAPDSIEKPERVARKLERLRMQIDEYYSQRGFDQ